MFVWRVLRGRLPVLVELDKRGINLNSLLCPMCEEMVETVDHSIDRCKVAKEVWDRVFLWWGVQSINNNYVEATVGHGGKDNFSVLTKSMWQATTWVVLYYLWKNRNDKVFGGKVKNSLILFNEIRLRVFDWVERRLKNKSICWLKWQSTPYDCLRTVN